MKTKSRVIAGIELGSSKITTIIANSQTNLADFSTTLNVVGVSTAESRGIRKGQIVDLEEAIEATISSVEAAERMAGYNLASAYVSLGGAHISSQNTRGVVAVSSPNEEIAKDDIDRVIDAASAVSLPSSRQLIHVIPREYLVDGEEGVKDPIGMTGVRLEVETHLITASAAAVKNIEKVLGEVGINVDEFVYCGIAASEATLTKTEKELGCVLVDVGGGTTSLAVYNEGALIYSGVIPIGSKNVTNDLAIGLRVSLESAEKIKIMLSKSKQKPKDKEKDSESDQLNLSMFGVEENKKISKKTLVDGIIRPRLNEIFTMVKIQLEREKLMSKIPSGIVVSGGGANVIGLEESAKRMLQLPVRVGIPKGMDGLIDDVINPSFATPVGLVIYGQKSAPKDSGMGFVKKLKLPSVGIASKIITTIKDLLP